MKESLSEDSIQQMLEALEEEQQSSIATNRTQRRSLIVKPPCPVVLTPPVEFVSLGRQNFTPEPRCRQSSREGAAGRG